jgi:TolB-like protein
MSLWTELQRRNVFKVGAAYAVVAWLLVQVAATVAPQLNLPEWAPRLITLLLMLGFPIALLVAWFLEHTPEGLRVETPTAGSKRMVGIAVALVALAVGWYLREARKTAPETVENGPVVAQAPVPGAADGTAPAQGTASSTGSGAPAPAAPAVPADPKSIAVLPFVNMSGETEQEYFADGLSEEILNSLTRIDGMQVAGRTSSFRFKGASEDLRRIGAQLGVASVLEGSVRRGRGVMRITAQLVRVSDGIHVWSQTYDRAPDDTLAVQLDIAEHVAGALDVVLDEAQRERMRESGVGNVEAFIAFQKGRQLYNDAHDPARSGNLIATLRRAGVEFARATSLEPDFAAAYYMGIDLYGHIALATTTTRDERSAAMEAASRDLALAARYSPDGLTRQLIEADRQLISSDWRGLADRLKAAAAAPGCVQANWLVASNIFGIAARRVVAMQQLMACDPLAALPYYQTATSANWAGLPAVAIEAAARGEATMGGSDSIGMQKVRALVTLGRIDQAQAETAGLAPGSAERMIAELVIAAATGGDVAGIAARSRDSRRLGWNPEYWEVADFLAEALLDDRTAGSRRAAAIDAMPGGPLKLSVQLSRCQCGVPFDLDATPNFKARLAESGLPWPPPDLIARLRRAQPPTP